MPEAVRGRTGHGSGEGVEEGAVMGENKQVESEKKVSEDQEKKNQENTAHKESKGQEGNNDKDKGGFFSLCPSILETNQNYEVYYEALDYAFNNEDIQNIAITGIYGAGKSTVWQSYVKKKNKKNIVTITLGQYESSVDKGIVSKIDRETVKGSDRTNYNHELEQENRIERKLINQIISQISIKNTPLSKYKIKINKSENEIYCDTICIVCFLLSILFWLEKEWIFEGLREPFKYMLLKIFPILEFESKAEFILQCLKHSSHLLYFIFCLLLFIIPVFYFLLRFVEENRFFIHKIQVKGVETIINDGNIDEETVLDKDIKEIIYLLTSAEVDTLVIEDLDRFNNITIFTKLRELNYMLNKHIEANYPEGKVKFVYMLRDGILEAKDRVKFFDFVLPILPYIHSRNSESILLSGMEGCGFKDNKHLIIKTSLYVGDMRILKNIVNEYRIYNNMLAMKKLQLSEEKLFALIVVKNLFPYDFDLLQVNQGGICYAFNKGKEELRDQLISVLPSKIYPLDADESDFEVEERIESERVYVSIAPLKGVISKWKEYNLPIKDSLIFGEGTQITQNPNISLLSFFIVEGYLSEDYWIYLSPFNEGELRYNDVVFLKRLIADQDNLYTELDSAEAVLSRLHDDDFKRKGILNRKLLTAILKQQKDDDFSWENNRRVLTIVGSMSDDILYSYLIFILASFEYNLVRRYIQIVLYHDYFRLIEKILKKIKELDESKKKSSDEYDDIVDSLTREERNDLRNYVICSILTFTDTEQVASFFWAGKRKNLIELSLSLVLEVPDSELDIFFENLKHANIQFTDLEFLQNDELIYKNADDKAYDDAIIRAIAERIQCSKTYILNVNNVQVLVNIILEKEVDYGELLSEIYNNDALEVTREYIREDFNNFITEYINTYTPMKFKNSEKIVIEILNSDISEEDKIKYVENNEIQIQDINGLEIPLDGIIAKKLYLNDTISCSKENITRCYAAIVLSDVPEFVMYLNRMINTENEEKILQDNSKLCEDLLVSEDTSEELFGVAIKYAKEPLDILPLNILENKCLLLIENNLINISKSNVHILVDSSYTKSIDKWLELAQEVDQDDLVEFLCTENLDKIKDYVEMFLRHLQEKNAIKLIDKVNGEIKIYRIDPNRTEIKKYLLLNFPITTENIQYICKNFKGFKYKQEFLDSLTSHNQFQDLTDEDLNKDVMNYLLTGNLVSIENKVILLQTKIQGKLEVRELKKYIGFVDEIKDLNEVWNHKQPKLNSTYKQDIGETLADNGYVKIRNTSLISRIVLLDSQRQ